MANGRNQIANWVNLLGYDAKGNVTGDGTYSYTYSSENLLTGLTNSATGAIQSASTYAYDPLMRLAKIDSTNPLLDAELGHDGQDIVLEALSNARTRRYVHGPGVDEPLVAYLVTSAGTSRSWYLADERGSTIRQSNDAGQPTGGLGRYDEYGIGPGSSRFQYTGQYWLGDAGLHYYRARVYDPKLGRFLQPDPIGYGGGMNMYAYVGGDPVNFTDPSGLFEDITINGFCTLLCRNPWASTDRFWNGEDGERRNGEGGGGGNSREKTSTPQQTIEDIIVEGKRKASKAARQAREQVQDVTDSAQAAVEEAIDSVTSLFTGTAHAPAPGPDSRNLRKVSDRDANNVARRHGYMDAHEAKKGRGAGRVNIYYDRMGGDFYLWDGSSPEKEPL